ncbi:hypothetical protein DL96DRAFT_1712058 [Flagelloscypha sp. PMI_526]|nr:hypothetical protein DL96DRAFT_1712058 [Flagelloscypha sp. PMI_526]
MLHRSSQEHQRLALETNLRGNMPDLSLNFEESVEYPRHMDSHPQSIQSWFHNDEEDEGIHPFAGETLSTAAHHASVLTLSAGLRGHHRRADTSYATSLSGAEYDPERSLFAMDPVFDKSNELDRLLQSGHQQRSVRIRSPLHSIASSSDTESHRSVPAASSRPKLSDTLRNNTTFSPKRPKNPSKSSPALATRVPEDDNPTPRPRRQHSAPAATFSGPEFRVQPPTPSIKASKPTRDSSYSNQQKLPTPSPLRRGVLKSNSSRRVYLPDVTGLTSAVESPAKGNLRHAMYTNGRPRDSEARLLAIVSSIQIQLTEMEQANGVSRRRVRELESELEDCKREVRRERARVDDLGLEAERLRKGKARAHDDEADMTIRYREVVEEKKALENLLTTLRSHLTRLTKELQSHQKFLKELRELRESDARSLEERGSEIQQLRDEVGRLKGEVDVLREVVEDGLRERRQKVRDHDSAQEESVANTAMSVEESDHESELEPLEPAFYPWLLLGPLTLTMKRKSRPHSFIRDEPTGQCATDYATLGTQSPRPAYFHTAL